MSGEKYPAKLVEKVATAIANERTLEAGGCWYDGPGNGEQGECADGDCECMRQCQEAAVAALDAIPYAAMREALRYGIGAAKNELIARGLPLEWTPSSGIGVMEAALRAADGEET